MRSPVDWVGSVSSDAIVALSRNGDGMDLQGWTDLQQKAISLPRSSWIHGPGFVLLEGSIPERAGPAQNLGCPTRGKAVMFWS